MSDWAFLFYHLLAGAIDVIDDDLCGIVLGQVVHLDDEIVVTGVVACGVHIFLDVGLTGGIICLQPKIPACMSIACRRLSKFFVEIRSGSRRKKLLSGPLLPYLCTEIKNSEQILNNARYEKGKNYFRDDAVDGFSMYLGSRESRSEQRLY